MKIVSTQIEENQYYEAAQETAEASFVTLVVSGIIYCLCLLL
jgi:hypothetical protein